ELGDATTQADEDEATRIDPQAPPRRQPPARGMPVAVLIGSVALAIAGLTFGVWAWLEREPSATTSVPAATLLPVVVPTAPEPAPRETDVAAPAPITPAIEPPGVAIEDVVEVVEDDAAIDPSDAARTRKKRSPRTSTAASRVITPSDPPARDPTPSSERPN